MLTYGVPLDNDQLPLHPRDPSLYSSVLHRYLFLSQAPAHLPGLSIQMSGFLGLSNLNCSVSYANSFMRTGHSQSQGEACMA